MIHDDFLEAWENMQHNARKYNCHACVIQEPTLGDYIDMREDLGRDMVKIGGWKFIGAIYVPNPKEEEF